MYMYATCISFSCRSTFYASVYASIIYHVCTLVTSSLDRYAHGRHLDLASPRLPVRQAALLHAVRQHRRSQEFEVGASVGRRRGHRPQVPHRGAAAAAGADVRRDGDARCAGADVARCVRVCDVCDVMASTSPHCVLLYARALQKYAPVQTR